MVFKIQYEHEYGTTPSATIMKFVACTCNEVLNLQGALIRIPYVCALTCINHSEYNAFSIVYSICTNDKVALEIQI